MFTVWEKPRSSEQRVLRREVLRVGALGACGLSLETLLRQQAVAAPAGRPKSVIYIVLAGGLSHIDSYDLKPHAPAEYRGPFHPISTRLHGVQICELMPLQAEIMDRIALVRGVRSVENDHFLSEVYTGLPRSAGPRPAFGSIASRVAAATSSLPPYVSLDRPTTAEFEFEKPHYAGSGHAPFRPFDATISDLAPATSLAQLDDRRQLLATFDAMRRQVDRHDAYRGLDRFQAQALDMITSPRVREAFDLGQEPPRDARSLWQRQILPSDVPRHSLRLESQAIRARAAAR